MIHRQLPRPLHPLGGSIAWYSEVNSSARCPSSSSQSSHVSPSSTDTRSAIRAGLHWGTIGGVRELVTRLAAKLETEPQVFVTGGGGLAIAAALADNCKNIRHVPHLVLSGIALAGRGAVGAP